MCQRSTRIRKTVPVIVPADQSVVDVPFDQVDWDELGIASNLAEVKIKKHGWYRLTQNWELTPEFSEHWMVISQTFTDGPELTPIFDVAEIDNRTTRSVSTLVEMFPGSQLLRQASQNNVPGLGDVLWSENNDADGLVIELVRELPPV